MLFYKSDNSARDFQVFISSTNIPLVFIREHTDTENLLLRSVELVRESFVSENEIFVSAFSHVLCGVVGRVPCNPWGPGVHSAGDHNPRKCQFICCVYYLPLVMGIMSYNYAKFLRFINN